MDDQQQQYVDRILRLFHPEKKYPFLPGADNDEGLARLHGLPLELYREGRRAFVWQVQEVADELLGDSGFREAIETIAVPAGGTIAVIGDSLTDDFQSWFEILARAFELARPADSVRFVNLAISGDTTAALHGMVVRAAATQPSWLLCLIGTNDARVQGHHGEPCTSLAEVQRNLEAVAVYARRNTAANWVWITPSGVDEQRIRGDWLLNRFQAFWPNEAVHAIADLIVARPEPAVDLRPQFASASLDPYSIDGLHWSIEGQKVAAAAIARELARLSAT